MVNYSWLLQPDYRNVNRFGSKKPVKHWYQSGRNQSWKKPIQGDMKNRHDGDFWNKRRKEVILKMDHLNLCDHKNHWKNRDRDSKNLRRMKHARCYLCIIRGHVYWNCPNRNKIQKYNKNTKQMHMKKGPEPDGDKSKSENATGMECKIVTPSLNWQVVGTDKGSWNYMWYVSENYPRHMASNKEAFYKFKTEIEESNSIVEEGLKVQGIGEVILQTENRNFVIPGVYFVPNIGLNTLSLSQLEQQGFKVDFNLTDCVVKRLFEDTSSDDDESDIESKDSMEQQEALNMMKERAVEAIMNYCDSLYFKENTIEKVDGKPESKGPSRYDFESLIGFMEMVSKQEIDEGCRDLVTNHFEKMVHWFLEKFMGVEERLMTPKVNGKDVCLYDLYVTVRNMGGHTRVFMENTWIGVAYAMGFPKDYANDLKECYEKHLGLLAAYYEVARDITNSAPKASEGKGASGETSRKHDGNKAKQPENDGDIEDYKEEPMEKDADLEETNQGIETGKGGDDYVIII